MSNLEPHSFMARVFDDLSYKFKTGSFGEEVYILLI